MANTDRSSKPLSFFFLFVLLATLYGSSSASAQDSRNIEQQIAAAQSTLDDAIARVKAIINQPVDRVKRTPEMQVAVSSPGWFHEGAPKPDFATVDIRATQELPYLKATYITSDLNPGEVFIGSQLEFNSMTKYFYVDRTVPKQRLDESEMLEVNRLYRIIAQSTQQLEQLKARNGLPFLHMSELTLGIVLVVIALAGGGIFFLWPALRR